MVETADALAPARSATWEELAGEEVRDRYTEMLEFTDYVERNRDLGRAARALKRGKEPADAVLGGGALGARAPRLPARHHRRAHRRGRGVGGAHGRLPGLRAPHAAARARDGHPRPLRVRLPAAQRRDRDPPDDARESHAWIEAWTGGWWGYDPTNDIEIGHRHVWVAVGRDYADVPPLKGVYSGGESSALDVTVDMTRLA